MGAVANAIDNKLRARFAPQRLVIIEKRPLLRECLEQGLAHQASGELVSYASADQFIAVKTTM